jgi:hypothetical protein
MGVQLNADAATGSQSEVTNKIWMAGTSPAMTTLLSI